MARAYSDDLRRKVLGAYRDGEGSLPQLAKRFRVSLGWAKKISAALLHTGRMERPPGSKRGRSSKVTAEALEYLGSLVRAQPDVTLRQIQEHLERDQKIELSIGQLWMVLKRMGLRLKKSRSTPPSRIRSESGRKGNSGGNTSDRSIRRGSCFLTKAASPRK